MRATRGKSASYPEPRARPPAGGRRAAPAAVQVFRSLASQAATRAVGADGADDGERPLPSDQRDEGSGLAETSEATVTNEAPMPPDPIPAAAAPVPSAGTARGEAPEERSPSTSARGRTLARVDRAAERQASARQDEVLGQHIVRTCANAAHGELLARQLTERISRFCAMSGEADDAVWAVTLPMNPAVLEDTLLHLQLSPSRIAIRFETPNAYSAQLIYDNVDALRVRLSDALRRQIDVDVTL